MSTLLKFASYFAMVKHQLFYKKGGPQLYGSLPYTHHLEAVVAVLKRFGCDKVHGEEILAAGLLHDSVEDTFTKLKEIEENFGSYVAFLVDAVTKVEAPNRKLAAMATYPKTRAMGQAGVALKLADRIANVENGGSMVDTYRKEHEDFQRNLYTPNENEKMWAHLNELMALKPFRVAEVEVKS